MRHAWHGWLRPGSGVHLFGWVGSGLDRFGPALRVDTHLVFAQGGADYGTGVLRLYANAVAAMQGLQTGRCYTGRWACG
jgi:hypothetical protein